MVPGPLPDSVPTMLTHEIHLWTMRSWKQLVECHPRILRSVEQLPIDVKAWMSLRLAKAFTVYDERGIPRGMEHPKENIIFRFDWQEGPPPGTLNIPDGRVYDIPAGLDLYIQWDTPDGPASGGLVSTLLTVGHIEDGPVRAGPNHKVLRRHQGPLDNQGIPK